MAYDQSVSQNPNTAAGQLMYIAHELHSDYSSLLTKLNAATSPQEAAIEWQNDYEQCQGAGANGTLSFDPAGQCMTVQREGTPPRRFRPREALARRARPAGVIHAGQACNASYALTGSIKGYTNPFSAAKGLSWTRTDQGVDACMPGAASTSASTSRSATTTASSSTATTLASATSCQYRLFADGAIGADPRCTPGAPNPAAVANPEKTICQQSYLAKLGKAEAGVQHLKLAMMIRYGSAGNPSTYVLAQLVPVEDGGSPTDPKNLWPILLDGWGGARTQAVVANAVHAQICVGKVTVRQAAQLFKGDWLSRGIPDTD